MAWTLRGSGGSGTTSGASSVNISLASGNNPQTGDRIFVLVGLVVTGADEVVTNVTDDQGNSYTRIGSAFLANSRRVDIWYANSAVNANNTVITVTVSGSTLIHAHAGAFGGGPVSIEFNQATGSSASATSHPCGSVSAINGDLLLSMTQVSAGYSPTPNADYSQFRATTRAFSQIKFPSGNFTSDATWTSLESVNTASQQIRVTELVAAVGLPFFTTVDAKRI